MERNQNARKNYSTHGNTAYANPTPRKVRSPQKRPSVSPITRKRVTIREPDSISLDSIFGFFVAGFLALLLISGYLTLASTSDEIVQLRSQLSALQAEQQILSSQYEKHFDIARIEEALGETLVRPTNDQMVYIDLSQPDKINIFGSEYNNSFFDAIKNFFVK